MRLRAVALAAACLLLPAAARADREADAVKALDDGWQLFLKGDLAAARSKFAFAQREFPDKPNPYRLLALVDAREHHCADALANLDQFLKRVKSDDPRYAEAVTLRDTCKGELARGTIALTSTPPGAVVRLDDEKAPPLGRTPLEAKVPPGPHTLFLDAPGYLRAKLSAQVTADQRLMVEGLLVKAPPPPTDKRLWIALGVGGGILVAAALALGLGFGLTASSTFSNAARFPPVMGP